MAEVSCTHCHLKFDESVMIVEHDNPNSSTLATDEKLYFCCKGCHGVYHLLRDEGLDTFYDKLGKQTLQPAVAIDDNLEHFDLDGFKNKYIKTNNDGLNEISLIMEGIHCSACVWLNEKVLHQTNGIIDATINYSNNKAKITWDPDEIRLSQIIEKIRSIGYNAFPYDPSLQEDRNLKTRNEYYSRIMVGVFATMNIMWLAIAQYAGYFTGITQEFKNILNVAEFVLATPTLFYSGWIFFKGAYYGLKNHFVNMDLLVATGASLAYAYSVYAMITGKGEVYFDSSTMIITFVLVGKYLEVLSKKQASDTLDKIMGTMPTETTVVKNGEKAIVSIENVQIDDIVELKPGEKVGIDGVLESGNALFDESSLTGESEPIHKQAGDEILSGTICTNSVIRYKVTKRANESMLYTITEMLSDSITKKPHIEQIANTISGYFSLVILSIAIFTLFGWYWYSHSFELSLITAISVVVIACPCALGLATPMATLIGVSKAAKKGLLFKESRLLETMAKSNILALDKTGTITEGKPSVVDAKIMKNFEPTLLLALVQSSKHPVSKGIERYLEEKYPDLKPKPLLDIKSVDAKGVTARTMTQHIAGGNLALMQELGLEASCDNDNTQYIFAIDKKIVAIFELRDKMKEGAKEVIKELKDMGIKVVMLTGDHEKAAKRIANLVGIEHPYYALTPIDKANLIDTFHNDGDIVVMAGDGINDALAMAKSDIACAMGSGADIAIDVSDVVLLNDSLDSLLYAFGISRRTFTAVKQNLSLSVLYNIIAVPLAVMGYITPLIAALAMSLSSLLVVANSSRIKVKERK